jgi:hypothetical protein
MEITERDQQPLNARDPIAESRDGDSNVTLESMPQSRKQRLPIVPTDDGMQMISNPEQQLKAELPNIKS